MCSGVEVNSISAIVVLEHSQTGTDHFAGVIVSTLRNLSLDEVLEVRTKCNGCCFHIFHPNL